LQGEDLLKSCPIDFVAVINQARKMTLIEAAAKPPQYKQRNWMAENMYGNIIGLLHENYPEYMQTDTYGRPYILLAPNIRVYLKKLTETYLPNNIKTRHVKKLNAQDLFSDKERISIVYAGFVLTRNDWALEFKEICITCLNRVYINRPAWTIDLTEEQYRKSISIISYMETATTQENLVSVSKKQEDKTGT
jgi:hypothetical protein